MKRQADQQKIFANHIAEKDSYLDGLKYKNPSKLHNKKTYNPILKMGKRFRYFTKEKIDCK